MGNLVMLIATVVVYSALIYAVLLCIGVGVKWAIKWIRRTHDNQ